MSGRSLKDKVVSRRVSRLSWAWCGHSLAFSIVYPFIPLYLHDGRGFPMSQVGLMFPAMGAGMILGPMVSGFLVDRFGRRQVLWGGMFARGLLFLLLAAMAWRDAPFWAFAAAMFVNSCMGMFFQNASDAYLADITTPEERPIAYSKIRVGTNVGWALGPMIGSFMARTPFSLLFALTGAVCLAVAFYVRATCPETVKRRPAAPGSPAVTVLDDTPLWRMLLADRHFLFVCGCSLTLFMLTSQLYSTLSVYSTNVVGVTQNMLGFVYAVNGTTIVLLQIPLNRAIHKLGLYTRMVGGSLFYAFGYLSLARCANHWELMVAVGVLTIGEIIMQPALYAVVSVIAPRAAVGRYMGTLSLVRGLGFSFGPYIGALYYERCLGSPAMLWGGLSLFGLAAALGFASLGRWGRRI